MSPNDTLRLLRIKNRTSKAEAAFKLGCSINEINDLEREGFPVTADVFLKLISIYSSSMSEIIEMNKI
jgi:transcriptional regulator with XRE-family HTH domain